MCEPMLGKDIANIVIVNPCSLMSSFVPPPHLSPSDVPPLPNSPLGPAVIARFGQMKFAAFTCIRLHYLWRFAWFLTAQCARFVPFFYLIRCRSKITPHTAQNTSRAGTPITEARLPVISQWRQPLFICMDNIHTAVYVLLQSIHRSL